MDSIIYILIAVVLFALQAYSESKKVKARELRAREEALKRDEGYRDMDTTVDTNLYEQENELSPDYVDEWLEMRMEEVAQKRGEAEYNETIKKIEQERAQQEAYEREERELREAIAREEQLYLEAKKREETRALETEERARKKEAEQTEIALKGEEDTSEFDIDPQLLIIYSAIADPKFKD